MENPAAVRSSEKALSPLMGSKSWFLKERVVPLFEPPGLPCITQKCTEVADPEIELGGGRSTLFNLGSTGIVLGQFAEILGGSFKVPEVSDSGVKLTDDPFDSVAVGPSAVPTTLESSLH